jgi:ketosteroid isomerase-like protein
MGEHVDALRERYLAFAQGDLETALGLAHDDVLWQGTPVLDVPGAGEHQGKEALARMAAEIPRNWDDFALSADQFVEEGDTVVVLGHVDARAKATGKPVKVPFAHVLTFEEGKVRRMTSLTDTALFVAALGKKPTAP